MAILPAGEVKTADHRKNIPVAVKLAVLLKQGGKAPDGTAFTVEDALSGNIQFDHRPPLDHRPFDTETQDFVPPQLSVDDIIAKTKAAHLYDTTGRKPGAERTVTTRGSDVGEASRIRKISASTAAHRARMDSKLTGEAPPAPERRRPQRKLQGRPFPKVKRPFPTRKREQ